jgi:thioredoxin-related protein
MTMKKLLCALFLTAVLVAFFTPPGWAGDYNGALKTAKSENKPVLLYFVSKTCYYCTLMDKDTMADSEVGGMLKRDFVVLRVDADSSQDLTKLYHITGTPSSWFLDSTGKRILEAPGYIQKPTYKKLLEYVKGKHYNNMDVMAYLKKTPSQK